MKAVIGFIVVTAAEVAGLVIWLPLALEGRPLAGLVALLAGEAVEWSLLAFLIAKSPASVPLRQGQVGRGLALTGLTSAAEAGLWLTWLALTQAIGLVPATVALFVAMHLKHGVDVAVFTGRPFRADLLSASALAASLWEVGGAAVWLALTVSSHSVPGILVLAACISVEHFLQFRSAGILGPGSRSATLLPEREETGSGQIFVLLAPGDLASVICRRVRRLCLGSAHPP